MDERLAGAKRWLKEQADDAAAAAARLQEAGRSGLREVRGGFARLDVPKLNFDELRAMVLAPRKDQVSRIPLRGAHYPTAPVAAQPSARAQAGGQGAVSRKPGQPIAPPGSHVPKRLEYLVDLTDPANAHHTIRRADPSGRTAYIEEFPASNLGVRYTLPGLRNDILNFAAGGDVDMGPQITYQNDDPRNPTPRQPLNARTAGMVGAAIVDSGLNSVNINSTTGGHFKPDGTPTKSLHNAARAVDMNRLNGVRVGLGRRTANPEALPYVNALQEALRRQQHIRENFGPAFQEKSDPAGRPRPAPSTRAGHQNHVHAGGQP